MSEWKETDFGKIPIEWELKKIIDLKADDKSAIAMGPFGSNIKAENFTEKGVPVIRGTNLNFYKYVDGKFVFLTEEKADELKGSNCKAGDLVFTHRGTVGQVGLIPKNKYNKYVISQSGMKLTVNPDLIDNEFLFYFFKSEFGQFQILKHESQVGVPSISNPLTSLKAIEVPVPPLPEQQSIASVLSSLDDKIDLLHRQNTTLEKMAETLFRQWFVRCPELVEGEEVKEEWEVLKIAEIANNIQYGFTQSANNENIGPKFLRITDIQGGHVNWESVPYCLSNENDFHKYELKTGDIVVARTGASTGENLFVYKPEKAVFASYLIRLQFSNLSLARYVALHMRSSNYFEYIEGILSGSAQPNANANELSSYEVSLPPKDKLESFYNIVSIWDEKKHINLNQIRTLTALRDTLLPKLMSGAVRVKND